MFTDLKNKKISEAQEILKELGLPIGQQNKIAALTLLAMCQVHPEGGWQHIGKISLTLSKGIMGFVNEVYKESYKPNTRESFRKNAVNPFIDFKIIDLNPDDPSLPVQSSKTHYSLSELARKVVRKYNTRDWEEYLKFFKKNQFEKNIASRICVKKMHVENYKSINSVDLEFGNFNVFIGANGVGKSNVLEALAMAGAAQASDLNVDGLVDRGVRIAKPKLTYSSFYGGKTKRGITINLEVENNDKLESVGARIISDADEEIYPSWHLDGESTSDIKDVVKYLEELSKNSEDNKIDSNLIETIRSKYFNKLNISSDVKKALSEFSIFELSTPTLRGLQSNSNKLPLGLHGEGIDVLINNLNVYELELLMNSIKVFDWFEDLIFDEKDISKSKGLKLGKSTSKLYFVDRYMQRKNNVLSAENTNEGILHVLFYLALFISTKSPNVFAIDNIETALNPKLCRSLVKRLYELSVERGKQAFITTHNPAILDGLNLNDERQRLFEVSRNDEGATKVRRIKFKPKVEKGSMKLSQMWLSGLLGATPTNF